VVEETPVVPAATVAEETVAEPAPVFVEPVVEAAPVQEVAAAVVVEEKAPVVQQQPVPVADVLYKHIATAPMTKAPAPDYVPEQQQQSDWQRPSFNFEGKGSAGGHAAANQATAPATKPQPVND
jgi:ribonuclease E